MLLAEFRVILCLLFFRATGLAAMGNSITSRNTIRGFAPQSRLDFVDGAFTGITPDNFQFEDTFREGYNGYPLMRKDPQSLDYDLAVDEVFGIYDVAPVDFATRVQQYTAVLQSRDPNVVLGDYKFCNDHRAPDRHNFTIQPVFKQPRCLTCYKNGQEALRTCSTMKFLDGLDTIDGVIARDIERNQTMLVSTQSVSDFHLQCIVADVVYILKVFTFPFPTGAVSPSSTMVVEAVFALQFFHSSTDYVGSFKYYSYMLGPHGATVTRIWNGVDLKGDHAIVLKLK